MRDTRVAGDERTEVIGLLNRALDQGDLPLDDYDHRVVAVGMASYTSELLTQLSDLPPEYAWLPSAAVAPPAAPTRSGRGPLILGLLSLPTSFCIFGGLLGLIAVVLSLKGEPAPGFSANLLGRVFGIVGIVMSIGASVAFVLFMRS